MESFYLTLPCQKSSGDEPKNKPQHFISDLPTEYHLVGDYEVGLVVISYTKCWFNLPSDQVIDLIYYDGDQVDFYANSKTKSAIVKAGYYTNEELILEINKQIAKHFYLKQTPRGGFFHL